MRLQDKVAVITGAYGNIGLQTAKAFIKEGAKVMLVGRNAASLEKAKIELDPEGTQTAICAADVTKPEDVARYAEETFKTFGAIDIFFNNAGIDGVVAPVTEYPEDAFLKVMEVNVFGIFLGMKYVIPKMKDGGSIIATSSVAGLKAPGPAQVGYTTSKHAVVGLVRSTAIDAAPRGIRVNSLHPGMVESTMMRNVEKRIAGNTDTAQVHDAFVSHLPLGRYVTLEEVSNMVVFLASDESQMVTGSQFIVDAGYMLN
ncbi:MAG: SDR family NAD(P)-dependent oxidoreductase [Sulfuricurvum sp.]